jgi:plasmid stabilization system protein ParE
MAYRVEIARSAEAQLDALYRWVIERAPHQGAVWFNGLEDTIFSLARSPERCPIAPESFDPARPVRVLQYGRRRDVYRIFFTVDNKAEIVRVIHVRHGAQHRLNRQALTGE